VDRGRDSRGDAAIAGEQHSERRRRKFRRLHAEREAAERISGAGVRRIQLPAEPEVQRESRQNLPIVLDEARPAHLAEIAIEAVVLAQARRHSKEEIGLGIACERAAEIELSGAEPVAGLTEVVVLARDACADAVAAVN